MVLIVSMLLMTVSITTLIAQCGLQNDVKEHYVNSNKNGTLIGVPLLKNITKKIN